MLTLKIIAFIAMVAGLFMLFKIRFSDVLKVLDSKPKSIRKQIIDTTKQKRKMFLLREIDEVKTILRITGREDKIPAIFIASLVFSIIGTLAASMLDNVFMIPVFAVGFMFIPVWYVKLTASHYKKDLAAELETALSIITTAYLRNEDIVTAVEENIPYLNQPVKEIFSEFVIQIKHIDANVIKAISQLKTKITNEVFHEWCDALSACQSDRNLKSTLTPIVAKLSDIRIVNSELELLLAEPRKEFIIMAFLLIANIPIMYFLNKDWYNVLMHSVPGKIILALDMAAVFISSAFVIKLTKPIEIRR